MRRGKLNKDSIDEKIDSLTDYQSKDELLQQLMQEYGEQLIRLAFTYTKDWGKAEDIVQDVFLTCYLKLDTFRGESSHKTWLYRITINRCKDSLKRWSFKHILFFAKPEEKSSPHLADNLQETPDSLLMRQLDAMEMEQKIFQLPVIYREVIILYYYEEMSLREMCELLNVKSNTLRSRLARGRKLIEEKLEDFKGGEDDGR